MANQSLSNFQKRFAAIQERLYTMEELQKMRDEAEQKVQLQRDIAKARKQLEEQQRIKDEQERKEREEEEDARRERRETYRLRRELRNPVQQKDPLLERPKDKDPTKIEKERQKVEEFLQGKKPSVPKKEQPTSPKEELRKQQLELLEKARQESEEPVEESESEPEVESPKLSKEEQLKLLEEAKQELAAPTEPVKPKGLISIKEERQMVEEFMKQKGVDQSEVEELLKDPALVEQPPPGGWKCMNQGHEDRPAIMKIRHNEVLGEGMPILTFCKECAAKFKMTPIMENNPSKAVLRSLSSLAIQLDKKGLYEEANAIDVLIEKLASNAGWRQVMEGGGEEEGSEEHEEKPAKKRWPPKKKKEVPVAPQKPKITCVTQGHTDRPAVVQMTHSGILGEELPPLNFCEDCALRVKMIPIGGKPSLITKRFSSINVLAKIIELATHLDNKGLYDEASALDKLASYEDFGNILKDIEKIEEEKEEDPFKKLMNTKLSDKQIDDLARGISKDITAQLLFEINEEVAQRVFKRRKEINEERMRKSKLEGLS